MRICLSKRCSSSVCSASSGRQPSNATKLCKSTVVTGHLKQNFTRRATLGRMVPSINMIPVSSSKVKVIVKCIGGPDCPGKSFDCATGRYRVCQSLGRHTEGNHDDGKNTECQFFYFHDCVPFHCIVQHYSLYSNDSLRYILKSFSCVILTTYTQKTRSFIEKHTQKTKARFVHDFLM